MMILMTMIMMITMTIMMIMMILILQSIMVVQQEDQIPFPNTWTKEPSASPSQQKWIQFRLDHHQQNCRHCHHYNRRQDQDHYQKQS